MRKIAIVTIVSYNYGNRLQNYALQTVLEEMGYKVCTIRRNKTNLVLLFKNIAHVFIRPNSGTKIFLFNRKIHWGPFLLPGRSHYSEVKSQYDFFVVGSDQVWNPYYTFTGTEIDFLAFAKRDQRIAYAASFGVSTIPVNEEKRIKDGLLGFDKISVRESDGAKIIKKLIGKDSDVVLDPTLLLSAERWRTIEKKPEHFQHESFVLVYSVHEMGEDFQAEVERIKTGKKIIIISGRHDGSDSLLVGPSEFLYLIDHADLFLTDSFHGVVFSILFHTCFKVFQRKGVDMSSRIETLLEKTHLKSECNNCSDFIVADKSLEYLREKSKAFLEQSLNSNKDKD